MTSDVTGPFHVFTGHINIFGETFIQVAFNRFAALFFPSAVVELTV